jgi:hypothetical protein
MFHQTPMPLYRIHRIKETPGSNFRWAAHTSGMASVKPRDYEAGDVIEAPTAYGAWSALLSAERPLTVGDLLEAPDGSLLICKYVGFEEARWLSAESPHNAAAAAPST